MEYLTPLLGVATGILIIVKRDAICSVIPKLLKRFPIYEDNAETFIMKFEVRSNYIIVLGLLLIFVAIGGLVVRLVGLGSGHAKYLKVRVNMFVLGLFSRQ